MAKNRNKNKNRNNIPQHVHKVSDNQRVQEIFNEMSRQGTDTEGYENVLIEMDATDEELEALLAVTNNRTGNSTAEAMKAFMRQLMA